MNQENQKNQTQDNAPKSIDGAASADTSTWKRASGKKWVFPAVYMAAAAIILALMWVYQDAGTNTNSETKPGLEVSSKTNNPADTTGMPAVPVNANKSEAMQWPVAKEANAQMSMPFFDSNASNDVKQAAIVEYGDSFTPHMGVDFSREDGQAFEVAAAMSGKVVRSEQVPLVGHVVEIEHEGGLKTVYHSLAEVKVKKDDQVAQGDIIATAGRNELEKGEGTHLHFEVLLDNQPVNPETYLMENQQ
ncbi:M23 family metallopeptidase [Paenibacillus turpanensis]|uniref:M23 family metallopeptidase n=1 Tax=Paenibacillus turpanensis TaxID=2689078 RepID=UPI00140DC851|nr:M23 family metallopeptidase [Paenibacillus turpanensis]